DSLNKKLDQILKQQKDIGTNLENKTNDDLDPSENEEKMSSLMQRMKDLEDKANKRVEQHNKLIKKIEDSTSTFNQASDDLQVRYKS
ncbi:hypothetical protein, partial [Staphylococcus saprophyticus]|uniref:hypothetical protein n=1 Tax=Staphylococcus saprophyticus TaxID=29385 RepID=UPI0028A2C9D4